MWIQVGKRIFKLLGNSTRTGRAFDTIRDYVGKTGNVKVISNPTPAQVKGATELSSSPSKIVPTLKKVGDMRARSLQVPSAKRTKGIKKQSGETGEGLTEAQKAARSRESQQKFLKAEKPARKRQEGIQSAREQRRWAERDAERKKGGKVGDKKQGYKARKDESIAQRVKKKRTPKQLAASRDESYGKWGKGKGKGKINHADGNKLVASLYD